MKLTFLGAAGAVTGSCYLLQTSRATLLLECGQIQGSAAEEALNRELPLPVPADSIGAVVLSHAHIDHSGRLPLLARLGYEGPVYTHAATRALSAIMLRDSGRIHERDAEWYNRKVRRRGEPELQPLYTEAEAIASLRNFVGIDYGAPLSLGPGLGLELRDAGHVLGSAIVVLDCDTGRRTRLCFTGDLGRRSMPLLRDPSPVEDVNVLIMESTYGDRLHPAVSSMRTSLADVVHRTVARGGKILIPAFALERAQTVVYLLHRLLEDGAIPPIPIYVDSPMTADITAVFKLHPQHFDAEARAFYRRHGYGDRAGFELVDKKL